MPAFVKYNQFVEDLGRKVHNLHTDTLKIALTNAAPNVATHKLLADITELAAGGGYASGGVALSVDTYAQTAGVGKLVATNDDTITATAGNTIGPARYAVLYNATAAGGPLIGYWDKGVSITLYETDSWVIDLDQSGGVLTIT